MPKSPRGGSRQPELFPRSKRPTVPIDEKHRLVQLADRPASSRETPGAP